MLRTPAKPRPEPGGSRAAGNLPGEIQPWRSTRAARGGPCHAPSWGALLRANLDPIYPKGSSWGWGQRSRSSPQPCSPKNPLAAPSINGASAPASPPLRKKGPPAASSWAGEAWHVPCRAPSTKHWSILVFPFSVPCLLCPDVRSTCKSHALFLQRCCCWQLCTEQGLLKAWVCSHQNV